MRSIQHSDRACGHQLIATSVPIQRPKAGHSNLLCPQNIIVAIPNHNRIFCLRAGLPQTICQKVKFIRPRPIQFGPELMIQIGLLARRFGKALRALGCHIISWTLQCRITAIAIAVARC